MIKDELKRIYTKGHKVIQNGVKIHESNIKITNSEDF